MTLRGLRLYVFLAFSAACGIRALAADAPVQISGVYPHLAAFNDHGECGIGAVVPWAGKLWFLTYPPHFRTGSTDKLYEVNERMAMTIRPESVGGTHANRFVHKESNQLIMGPYFIDEKGAVRAADVKKLVGRLTATGRHLTDPANKVYFVDMEGPVWEVDVKTLEPKRLFVKPVPGWHSKGAYSGQGVLVVANNGEVAGGMEKGVFELPVEKWSKGPEEAGVLAEWNGQGADGWRIISRRQHTDVTGPGGIFGPRNDSDPIWSMGWDKRSILLHVRDAKDTAWHQYRLPKASHTYDPKHGWYTEWPRIREIEPAQGDRPARLMMTMHGMMFDFPQSFAPGHTAGIRPIASYLRYIPDFCHWNGRVVLASDDTSIMQNPLAGVSQSNLWFGKAEQLAEFGPASGWGGVWMGDAVKAGQPSDPYLLAGFAKRVLHVVQKSSAEVAVSLEIDEKGDGQWKPYTTLKVPANGYAFHVIPPDVKGEWIRLTSGKDTTATAYFHYATPSKYDGSERAKMFAAFDAAPGGFFRQIVRPGANRNLQLLESRSGWQGLFEVDERMAFKEVLDAAAMTDFATVAAIDPPTSPPVFTVDDASVVITTKSGRFRLPKGDAGFDALSQQGAVRTIREVASERNLANIHGTFYEVPRSGDNAAGKAEWKNAKPVASHNLAITDFCTWRGLLVLAGTKFGAKPDGHFFKAGTADGDPGVWFGQIDDLWRLGKPVGRGGPWKDMTVEANKPSDPYLMTNYDRKTLTLSHDAPEAVTFSVQVDPSNTGFWHTYQKLTVEPGKPLTHAFPDGYGAYWVRVIADKPCKATATFVYE